MTPDQILANAGARLHQLPPPRGKTFGQLTVLSIVDAAAAPPRDYLLQDIIAVGEMSLWWGAPKSGKSFLLSRIAFGLALGKGAWGREAKPCSVLYVAAEGEGGFAGRLLALRDALGDPGSQFRYIAQRVTIGPPNTHLLDLKAAAGALRPDFIVLDTVARTFGDGDESSTRDMGAYVAAIDELREHWRRTDPLFRPHVALIHHGPRDGSWPRGSIALPAAADLVVKIEKKGEGRNLATVESAKDEEEGGQLAFHLEPVQLAPVADSPARMTCIAIDEEAAPAAAGAFNPREARLTPADAAMLREVRNLSADTATPTLRPQPDMPMVRAVTRARLRRQLVATGWFVEAQVRDELPSAPSDTLPRQLPPNGSGRNPLTDAGMRHEHRRLQALQNKGLLNFNREHVWLT
jgi:hypothetical protein